MGNVIGGFLGQGRFTTVDAPARRSPMLTDGQLWALVLAFCSEGANHFAMVSVLRGECSGDSGGLRGIGWFLEVRIELCLPLSAVARKPSNGPRNGVDRGCYCAGIEML